MRPPNRFSAPPAVSLPLLVKSAALDLWRTTCASSIGQRESIALPCRPYLLSLPLVRKKAAEAATPGKPTAEAEEAS